MPVQTPLPSENLFEFKDVGDFSRLRDALDAQGFTEQNILDRLNVSESGGIREEDRPLLLYRTRFNTPLDTLIRLFLIEAPCWAADVEQALAPMPLESLVQAGVLEIDGDTAHAGIKLLPFKNLIVAFDRLRILHTPEAARYVMGIGQSTLTLSNLTVRTRCSDALDLGCGCGVHALLAASHCDRVTAADINPRAVRLARFNARLNGLPHVECLEGDLLQPVAGRAFDLILTNPPFVISPEKRYIYRDGGLPGDDLCRKIIDQAPACLKEGGMCQILCNWAEPEGRDWRERLRTWFDRKACDVWILRSETRDAATYASAWIRHTERDNRRSLSSHFDQWMAYYARHGIERIGAGVILFRKNTPGPNWFSAEDAPDRMIGPAGDQVARGFALRAFLHGIDNDRQLLETRLRRSPDVRLERHSSPGDDGWSDQTYRLFIDRGLCYSGTIDPAMANAVVRCDGKRYLKDLLAETAAALGHPPDAIAPGFCGIIRTLIRNGVVVPEPFITKDKRNGFSMFDLK